MTHALLPLAPLPLAPLPLAHGVGTRADLPIPTGFAIVGGGVAVGISFVALALLWKTPKLHGDEAGRPLPAPLAAALDSRALTVVLRLLALLAAGTVAYAGLAGTSELNYNLAPWAFYVTFWVGLVPASLLLGPVWARVNPLRSLHWVLSRLTGPAPGADQLERLGVWPAAAALTAYAVLELTVPNGTRTDPRTIGVFLTAYAVVQLGAALWFGPGWFARGDGFEVWSTLLGRLSPWGRRSDGRLVVRNPLSGSDGTPPLPGLPAVVVVLVGTTAFDGLTRTTYWQNGPAKEGEAGFGPSLLGMVVMVLVVALLYVGASSLAGTVTRQQQGPRVWAHSVVPIAAGYAIAHYFSLWVFDGQKTWINASDPTGFGNHDFFGTRDNITDYSVVSARTIALVQVGAIVIGHVLGVVLAHDRAVRLAPKGTATTSQVPLLIAMVALTVGGLFLLLGG